MDPLSRPKPIGIAPDGSAMVATMKKPNDLADRMRGRRDRQKLSDDFSRETFTLPLDEARQKARALLDRYPVAAYMTEVECWRELHDGCIEFTMRWLPTAD